MLFHDHSEPSRHRINRLRPFRPRRIVFSVTSKGSLRGSGTTSGAGTGGASLTSRGRFSRFSGLAGASERQVSTKWSREPAAKPQRQQKSGPKEARWHAKRHWPEGENASENSLPNDF